MALRLTKRQRAFSRAYVGPAREVAYRAAELAGYSDPAGNASRVRNHPLVAADIERRLEQRDQAQEQRCNRAAAGS